MIDLIITICMALCAVATPLFVGIAITRRQVRREAAQNAIAVHQYHEARVEGEVAAQNRLQEMEHELLSPFFLELEVNTWGSLGHNFGCRDCYPAGRKYQEGDEWNASTEQWEPESSRSLTPEERREMCEDTGVHDDSYERGYCKWCGESKPDDEELWPGWGVG